MDAASNLDINQTCRSFRKGKYMSNGFLKLRRVQPNSSPTPNHPPSHTCFVITIMLPTQSGHYCDAICRLKSLSQRQLNFPNVKQRDGNDTIFSQSISFHKTCFARGLSPSHDPIVPIVFVPGATFGRKAGWRRRSCPGTPRRPRCRK